MAISETYCDPATGNDYKGATFTDGAFTEADMTLTKAGAFTASKANHWLYLTDNGSNEITDGYYRIASVTSANAVVLATSPKSGANDPTDVKCTQHDGTTSLPWHSVQGALDLITRDATNGDRVNVKAGTADVLSAALSLTTYGTPTYAVPLVIQGYTSAAGDGGMGEINNGGANVSVYNSATVPVSWIDMKLGNTGTASPLTTGPGSMIGRCEIHTSSSYPRIYTDLALSSALINCYLHDLTGGRLVIMGNGNTLGGVIYGCYFSGAPTVSGIYVNGYNASIVNNIIVLNTDTSILAIDMQRRGGLIANNTIYCSSANTQTALSITGLTNVFNNIVQGYSGAGGTAFLAAGDVIFSGGNAYYNNTTPESVTAKFHFALAANDTLGASPFVNAATGDFDINGAVSGVTEDAYPQTWPGLSSSTAPKPDKGASQAGAGSGGGGFPILGGSVVR